MKKWLTSIFTMSSIFYSTKIVLYRAHRKPFQICCSVLFYALSFLLHSFSTIHIHISANEIFNVKPISSC